MKKIIFAVDQNDKFLESYRPYKHQNIALPEQKGRPMFIPDYHAPLTKVYEDNGYAVTKTNIKDACQQSDPFVYLISPQPNIFTLLKEEPQKIVDLFNQIDTLLIDAINTNRCAMIVHNCKEQYAGNKQIETKFKKLLLDIGIKDPKNIIILENSPNAKVSDMLNFVQWNYFETAVRLLGKDYQPTTKFKANYKKFLCVNFTPRYHRKDFMYAMRDSGILNDFNASHNDSELPLSYDTDTHNINLKGNSKDIKPSSGHIPMLIADVNHWNTIPTKLKQENLIFVVTETPFQSEDLLFNTEKTFKPILLKMPFILLSNFGSLKYLKGLGYKTFSHMWSEHYDNILDKHERLQEICTVIKQLSTLTNGQLKKLILDNNHILEHNYNLLMSRRPETKVFDAVDKVITRQ